MSSGEANENHEDLSQNVRSRAKVHRKKINKKNSSRISRDTEMHFPEEVVNCKMGQYSACPLERLTKTTKISARMAGLWLKFTVIKNLKKKLVAEYHVTLRCISLKKLPQF
jgi:hypothetical protein